MHRVLAIPELLNIVCSHLDNYSCTSVALVCKTWSSAALDALWEEMHELEPLFTLLGQILWTAPVEFGVTTAAGFVKRLDPSNWKRFEHYGRRVRRLILHPEHLATNFYRSVFNEIAISRTTLNILPNLVTLGWDYHIDLGVTFMSPKVRELILPIVPPSVYDLYPIVSDIVTRMPNITKLELQPSTDLLSVHQLVTKLLDGLDHLEKVLVSRFFISSEIFEVLSHKASLKTIEFTYTDRGKTRWDDVRGFSPTLDAGSFPVLDDLNLTVALPDITSLLELRYAPRNITSLYVHSFDDEATETIASLLSATADVCKQLRALYILSSACGTSPKRITYDTLSPLRSMPELRTLELIHHNPIDITAEQVEQLSRGWPLLEALLLNNEPSTTRDASSLTLESIHPFAKHCPNLQSLGLFVRGTLIPATLPSLDYGFSKPVKLVMGTSSIEDPGAVALYLSRLCNFQDNLIHVEGGITIDEEHHPLCSSARREEIEDRCIRWQKVNEFLPLLVQLRWEDKMRNKALVAEVEDLRMRNQVLVGNAKLQGSHNSLTRRLSMLF